MTGEQSSSLERTGDGKRMEGDLSSSNRSLSLHDRRVVSEHKLTCLFNRTGCGYVTGRASERIEYPAGIGTDETDIGTVDSVFCTMSSGPVEDEVGIKQLLSHQYTSGKTGGAFT